MKALLTFIRQLLMYICCSCKNRESYVQDSQLRGIENQPNRPASHPCRLGSNHQKIWKHLPLWIYATGMELLN